MLSLKSSARDWSTTIGRDAHGRLGSVIVSAQIGYFNSDADEWIASIYCVPLKTPTVMVKELKENATTLEPLVSDIGIRHPLVHLTQLADPNLYSLAFELYRPQSKSPH
jgi:hypothetical protein